MNFRYICTIQVSDIREAQYEKSGIGSSYLFRLDDDYVVGVKDYSFLLLSRKRCAASISLCSIFAS
jgi:hypothetical protein